MPNATVYIKPEDFELWKSIPNKSGFIHNALVPHYGTPPVDTLPKELPTIGMANPTMVPATNFKPCKHGADPNFCKFAKPGKPCKIK